LAEEVATPAPPAGGKSRMWLAIVAVIVAVVIVSAVAVVILTAPPPKYQIELWFNSDGHYGDTEDELATVLKNSIESCGKVQVTLKSEIWATYRQDRNAGRLPFLLMGWYPDYTDTDDYLSPFLTSSGSRGFGSFYSNATVDGWIDDEQTTTDPAVRADRFSKIQQELARDVFLRLTELGEGTEDTRRRAALNELVRQSAEATQLRAVLNTLAEARLITLNEDNAEVAHEALIREWQRLHEWLTQDREGLLLHRHLTESAHEWEVRGHDPAELYRGARLAQAREWVSVNEERLNAEERAFLAASLEQEQHDALEREAQRQRELEAVQKLAETQSRSAQ